MIIIQDVRYMRSFMMKVLIIWFLFSNSSCIRDGLTECTDVIDDNATLLYVKVTDVLTGKDITGSNEVEKVDIFVFKEDSCLLKHLVVNADSIRQGLPVLITDNQTEPLFVSVWGNLHGSQTVSDILDGCKMRDLSITLIKNETGHAKCPDDLFFGATQIDYIPTRTDNVNEVSISRKNARMNITVHGLPKGASDSDYYFTICNGNNGYDFMGSPLCDYVEMKQSGVFRTSNDFLFVTPVAFNLVHMSSSEQCMTVNLHKDDITRTSSIIASVTQDSDGNLISPVPGLTTNILIDLTDGTASITVTIETTSWDTIYHWLTF